MTNHATKDEIIAALKANDPEMGYCVYLGELRQRYGKYVEPCEVFLPTLNAWVRADGSLLNLDMGRGSVEFKAKDADDIRDAVKLYVKEP